MYDKAYFKDKELILSECADILGAVGNLKMVCANDPHVIPVAYFIEKRAQAIKDVFLESSKRCEEELEKMYLEETK